MNKTKIQLIKKSQDFCDKSSSDSSSPADVVADNFYLRICGCKVYRINAGIPKALEMLLGSGTGQESRKETMIAPRYLFLPRH